MHRSDQASLYLEKKKENKTRSHVSTTSDRIILQLEEHASSLTLWMHSRSRDLWFMFAVMQRTELKGEKIKKSLRYSVGTRVGNIDIYVILSGIELQRVVVGMFSL